MDLIIHLSQMADYNQWSNQNLLRACSTLDNIELHADKGAFFSSIIGSFNHLLVADLIWLRRFAECSALSESSQLTLQPLTQFPATTSLDQLLHLDITAFAKDRKALDALILEWVDSLDGTLLNLPLPYRNTKGIAASKPLGLLLSHFFNHQTHHRAQIGTLLYQAGIDPGVTDLLVRIPDSNM